MSDHPHASAAGEPTDDQLAKFRDDGYFVTPPLFDAPTLLALRTAVEARWRDVVHAAAKKSPDEAEWTRTRAFLVHNHAHGSVFLDFCLHPVFAGMARRMIGPDVDLYWNQAIVKPGPDGRALPWHQDAKYAITDPLDGGFTALVAVTPSTTRNGTVWALPGRHRDGLLPHVFDAPDRVWICQIDRSARVPIEMEPGQALIFSRLLPHYSGPNGTSQTRISFQLGYGPPGLVTADTREPFGDGVPFLRGGDRVRTDTPESSP
jgi:phytanoyl-CoA hydroxylase